MEDHNEIIKEAFSILDSMLQELYFAKVNDLIYDQFDVNIHKLKEKYKEDIVYLAPSTYENTEAISGRKKAKVS